MRPCPAWVRRGRREARTPIYGRATRWADSAWIGRAFSGILRAMLIDAHNHPNWHGHDADRLLANMEEHGIDRMWLFSWEVPGTDYNPSYHAVLPPGGVGIPLEDVLNVGRAAPDRFVLGYMPDVKRPDAIDRLKAAVEIHGIRIASELKQRVLFDDPDALDIYHFCGEQKLPITIHLDYPIPTDTAIRAPTGGTEAPWTASSAPSPRVRKPSSSATRPGSGGTFRATTAA